MTTILNNASNEEAILSAIETNMFSFWAAYGQAQGGDVFQDERLLRVAVPLSHPLYNAVFGAQLSVVKIDPTIDETIAYYRARPTPFYWWTGPITRPSNLHHWLLRHGLVDDGGTPGMAIDLADLPENVPTPEGFEIVTVTDDAGLRQWLDIAIYANDRPQEIQDALYRMEQSRGFGEPPTRYIGLLNGVPVARAVMHYESGVAGIYSVATLPDARGKGIGTLMTLKPYQDAMKHGYRVGILQASTQGYSLYKRLGFKKYCDLGVYLYQEA